MKKCSVEGCDGKHYSLGFCNKHYKQYKKYGEVKEDRPEICSVEGCEEKHHALGFCNKHYMQIRNHGRIIDDDINKQKNLKCSIEGCNEKHCAKGFCKKHYDRWQKTGSALPKEKIKKICSYEGCEKEQYCKGFCENHDRLYKKYGQIPERIRNDLNEIVKYNDYAEIILYDKQCNEVARALIDLDDIDKCKKRELT